jgi:hypothetical protein
MEEIIYEVQEHCLNSFTGFMEKNSGKSGNAKEDLKNVFIAYINFGIENPDMYKLLFGTNTEMFLKNKRHGMKGQLIITPESVIDTMKQFTTDDKSLETATYQLYIIAHGVVDSVNNGIMKNLVGEQDAFLKEFIDKIVATYTK